MNNTDLKNSIKYDYTAELIEEIQSKVIHSILGFASTEDDLRPICQIVEADIKELIAGLLKAGFIRTESENPK